MRRPQWCVLEWIVHSQLPCNGKVDISQTQHRMVANLRQSALLKEMQQVIDNRKMFVALPVPISAFNKGHVVEYSLLPPVEWYKPLRKFESLFIVITHSPRPMYSFCNILLEQGFRVTSHWRGLNSFQGHEDVVCNIQCLWMLSGLVSLCRALFLSSYSKINY
jgi:hypothetical protein